MLKYPKINLLKIEKPKTLILKNQIFKNQILTFFYLLFESELLYYK